MAGNSNKMGFFFFPVRKWFGHDPEKWRSFRERYQTELKHRADQLGLIDSEIKEGTVTLVYGARDRRRTMKRLS